jgi:centromere/kinetochore protein ZW10
MMPILSARIKEYWLDNAVPTSLDDLRGYQVALVQVADFASELDKMRWPDTASFHDWVSGVPKIWLAKRRETSLDWIRNELALGKPFFLATFHRGGLNSQIGATQ